jgi:hypothetical protein
MLGQVELYFLLVLLVFPEGYFCISAKRGISGYEFFFSVVTDADIPFALKFS